MSNNERFSQILEYLKIKKSASVEELSKMLYVSVATIRRDLTELQKRGQINRSHGGAILMEGADEISIFIRQVKNAKEKEKAVSIALKHIPEYQVIFIDNSSTCLALSERMDLAHKTVITNGLQVALQIAKHDDVNLIVPGGEVKYNMAAVHGSMAANNINHFNFDLAIISCSAVDKDGSYEFTLESAEIKKAALRRSKTRMLVFDNTKVNTSAAFMSSTLEDYDIIVTNATDNEIALINRQGEIDIFNK